MEECVIHLNDGNKQVPREQTSPSVSVKTKDNMELDTGEMQSNGGNTRRIPVLRSTPLFTQLVKRPTALSPTPTRNFAPGV